MDTNAQKEKPHDEADIEYPHAEILPPLKGDVSPIVAAEINQQVATARRFPRRPDKAISDEIMSRACLDEETAAECMYALPRAGKDITGPSVRFAELVFVSYGNLRAGARFVDIDMKDRTRAAVIIEGVCLDLQSNVATNIPVRRSIVGRKGVFGADMTNIAFSAGAAIARREAILKTVPKAIWGSAYKRVIAILQGDATTLAKRRANILAAFAKRGVEEARVLTAMGVATVAEISMEHMPRLFGMITALADGSETVDSMFSKPASEVPVRNPMADDDAGEAAGDQQQAQPAAKAPAKPADDKPKPADETPPAQPKDEAAYMVHARAQIKAMPALAMRKEWWKSERALRKACNLTSEAIETLSAEVESGPAP